MCDDFGLFDDVEGFDLSLFIWLWLCSWLLCLYVCGIVLCSDLVDLFVFVFDGSVLLFVSVLCICWLWGGWVSGVL